MLGIRYAGVVLTILVGIQAEAWAQGAKEASQSYDKSRELGAELYGNFMGRNAGWLRASATLNACNKPDLARSVFMKTPDNQLVAAVDAMMNAGRFRSYQPDLALQSQSVATAMIGGYAIGYEDAIKQLPENLRKIACQVAEEFARSH